MPPRNASKPVKRRFTGQLHANGRPHKQRRLTTQGTESQPIAIDDTQPSSPREALAIASQADDFESQLRDSRPEDEVVAPVEASEAATVASTALEEEDEDGFDGRFADNFDGVDWKLLKGFIQPPRTQTQRKSWVYRYGYRVALQRNPIRIFWACHICHRNKRLDHAVLETTTATSSVQSHLRRRHQIDSSGHITTRLPAGQRTLSMLAGSGVLVSQRVANEIGQFDVQAFRLAAVHWLVDCNIPLRLFEEPTFRRLMEFANPDAERALWRSHNSVKRYVMRLYEYLQPQIVAELEAAISKIHISFDGWTTKGGKRGFFGVVAHYATADGVVKDIAIDLPQVTGAHSGERIADCIESTLRKFGIVASKLGYFMLDNAYNNDAAIKTLGSKYGFVASQRRLRCSAHTINLVGQAVIFGSNRDAFDNDPGELQVEEELLAEWRKQGPLGTLLDVINYIRTPQQHEVFRNFQDLANRELPAENQKIREIVKPCVTRWNSYCSAFERAVELQPALNSYIAWHTDSRGPVESRSRICGNRAGEAATWMRSGGLSANDWAVVKDYIEVLQPLKSATKRLEGRGKSGRFGAIYEVLPIFEYLLSELEQRYRPYELVNYEATGAPEDHLAINLKAAWAKINDYYSRLDESPVYFAAVCLHPYYKFYCDRAWSDKPSWLCRSREAFQQLWSSYQLPRSPKVRTRERNPSAIDDAIAAIMEDPNSDDDEGGDEYLRWRTFEPKWSKTVFESPGNSVIAYWIELRSKYPNLARFAIDILTIPASSCDCERVFSEVGDLLAPRRRNMGSQLLAALQCVRSWMKDGKQVPPVAKALSDDDLERLYDLAAWDEPEDQAGDDNSL